METKLNIFLFFAFILILGLCYLIKNDETTGNQLKAGLFSEKNIRQPDLIGEEGENVDFNLKDTITTVYAKNQK